MPQRAPPELPRLDPGTKPGPQLLPAGVRPAGLGNGSGTANVRARRSSADASGYRPGSGAASQRSISSAS
jgi:hypothetical protein